MISVLAVQIIHLLELIFDTANLLEMLLDQCVVDFTN